MLEQKPYLIELLTPRQSDEDFEGKLEIFGQRYRKIMDHGATVSIPDNPMGHVHFTAMEVVEFLGLPFDRERTLLHLNTFHRKVDLDTFLEAAATASLKHLLVVRGDGGPRLAKLEPSDIGSAAKTVTSVELLEYIRRQYPGAFTCGVAFNHYEPPEHELEKLRRKIEAGARFLITQPVIGSDSTVSSLRGFGLPVWVGAWMSRKVKLLLECVGAPSTGKIDYDPAANLEHLHGEFRDFGIYLTQLGFKKDWCPLLTRSPCMERAA